MLIVVAAAVLGAIVTVVAKRDPGSLLGWFIVAGTLIAGFAARPRSAYLLIPVPALAYVVFGLAVGLIRNHSDPSSTGLTVSAAQWVANGFLTMAAATVLAVLIALSRWYLDRRAAGASAGRRRAGSGGRRGPEERLDRAEDARGAQSDSSGLIDQSDETDWGGQRGRSDQGGRSGQSDQAGRDGRDGRSGPGGRTGQSDQTGRGGRDGRSGPGGRTGRSGSGGQSGSGGRVWEEAQARPKPAFYPNPDWPGDRGRAPDPRDRRPPPGPPSFGASRDLTHQARSRAGDSG